MHSALRATSDIISGLLVGTNVAEYVGDDPNGTSGLFAVYVHYDGYGIVHRYVIEQVAALAKAGFRVVFVSNAPGLQLPDILLRYCRIALHRRNVGHDFGAYRDGLRWIRAQQYRPRAVLLMNDSCYGFFGNIEKLELNVCDDGADLWGFTESYEFHYHLQSYFLLLSRRLFEAPVFWDFWDSLSPYRSRRHIILHGEVGLSQFVLRSGFRVRSYVDYQEAAQVWLNDCLPYFGNTRAERKFVELVGDALITSHPLNPTHYFWELLVSRYHVPLVKRDLMRDNPEAVPGTHRISSILAAQGWDVSATLEHLRFRTSRNGILSLR